MSTNNAVDTVNRAIISEALQAAECLTVKRVSDGGMHIASNGKTITTCLRSNAFDAAISGIVIPDVKASEVARIELSHVAPQLEFTVDGIANYFSISCYSVDNVLLGGKSGIRTKPDVAKLLTANLAP